MHTRVPTILACCSILSAVDLPVVQVTIAPDGAWVERAGILPANDGEISGLPNGMDLGSASLLVDHLPLDRVQVVNRPPSADPVADRRRELRQTIAACDERMTQATQRGYWTGLVAKDFPDVAAGGGKLPPIAPAAWAAHEQAVLSQFATSRSDHSAAMAERHKAQEELNSLPAPALARDLGLSVPRMAQDRPIRLAYRMQVISWSLAWRCVLDESAAELVPVATVRNRNGEDWGKAPVQLVTRRANGPVTIGDLQVRWYGLPEAVGGLERPRLVQADPILTNENAVNDVEMGGQGAFMAIGAGGGSSGMFGNRSGGGRKRAVGKFGGSRASESAVEGGFRQWTQAQQTDGTFAVGAYRTEGTALVLLGLLGAGYDHKTPNRFRQTISKAISWLAAEPPARQSFTGLALGTLTLAEAYAMTNDQELRPICDAWRDRLITRVQAGDLDRVVADPTPLNGGFAAVVAVMAMKSSLAAGLDADVQSIATRASDAANRISDPLDRLAATAAIQTYSGKTPVLPGAMLDGVAGRLGDHVDQGRIATIYLLNLAAFQVGGDAWKNWNNVVRDHLIQRQSGAPPPHPAGEPVGSALLTLCLEVYYRYAQVTRVVGKPAVAPPPPDPAQAAQGWPVTFTLPAGLALARDRDTVVDLAPIRLQGRLQRHAFPIVDNAVWRRFTGTNPGPAPLPAGPCVVVIDGSPVGSVPLPFTPPAGQVTIGAGIDQRLAVERRVVVRSEDGWLSGRKAYVTITDQVTGPPGLNVSVTVSEPLPRPRTGVEITLQNPELSGRAAEERLDKDPYQRADVKISDTLTVIYKLSYATDQRPVLEIAP